MPHNNISIKNKPHIQHQSDKIVLLSDNVAILIHVSIACDVHTVTKSPKNIFHIMTHCVILPDTYNYTYKWLWNWVSGGNWKKWQLNYWRKWKACGSVLPSLFPNPLSKPSLLAPLLNVLNLNCWTWIETKETQQKQENVRKEGRKAGKARKKERCQTFK
jgi:hypothetical protein